MTFFDAVRRYDSNRHYRVAIFGAAEMGKLINNYMKWMHLDVEVIRFFDNDPKKWNTMIDRIEVRGSDEILSIANGLDYIIIAIHNKLPVITQLKELGISEKNIIISNDEWVDFIDQYFDKNLIQFHSNEIFLDCGCLNFLTSERFMERCPDYKKIYAFEPDSASYKICKSHIEMKKYQNVQIENLALWDKKEVLHFEDSHAGSSKVSVNGWAEIGANSIDEYAKENDIDDITFIKMDLEGAELNALKGAKSMIQKCRPKLAISVYHSSSDLTAIPRLVKQMVPEYKLYLRHYSSTPSETIMYAIYDGRS